MHADILLINLTRFGDLLQSQALLHDLHAGGRKPGLLCLENFAGAVPLLSHVHQAWTLPGASLMAQCEAHWPSAVACLLELAGRIKAEARLDYVINLTPSLSARLLARLLAPEPSAILGFGLDADGFGFNKGLWASFLSGATQHRLNTPFNIVDMFRMMGGPALAPARQISLPSLRQAGRNDLSAPPPVALAQARSLLEAVEGHNGPPPTAFVGLQLGASDARRQWPVEYFAALGQRLWEEGGFCPVLLGAPAEAPLAEAYAAQARGPFVNAVGKTNIPQLAGLLQGLRLLVTNDTGTMHLAAGLGLPCLAFFLATAQPWDTGPYLHDCCCLEPALPCHPCPYSQPCPHNGACLRHIGPQHAGDLALARLSTGAWATGLGPALCEEARVWITDVDQHGFACLRSLSGHEGQDRSRWLNLQRHFWRQILDDLGQVSDVCCAPAAPPLPCSPEFRATVAPVLEQAAQWLSLLGEQGQIMGRSPRAGQLFLLNCERLQRLLDHCPPLAALGFFWRELRQEHGGRLDDLLPLALRLAGHLRAWAASLA